MYSEHFAQNGTSLGISDSMRIDFFDNGEQSELEP